jgi:tRNA 2-(methylsulfanyl)-N6-isopentenyladenosine37 hydroxylase
LLGLAIVNTITQAKTIKFLQMPTAGAWVEQALANLDTVLLDHAHCERKAAGVALNLMFRYPSSVALVDALTEIAQEELAHFKQVNQWLKQRGIVMRALTPAPYGAALRSHLSRQEPDRMLDSLLMAALIEARSHERLGLLAQHIPEPALAQFYHSLMASEARHYGAYWVLATTYFETERVNQRLEALATLESEILATLHPEARIHS